MFFVAFHRVGLASWHSTLSLSPACHAMPCVTNEQNGRFKKMIKLYQLLFSMQHLFRVLSDIAATWFATYKQTTACPFPVSLAYARSAMTIPHYQSDMAAASQLAIPHIGPDVVFFGRGEPTILATIRSLPSDARVVLMTPILSLRQGLAKSDPFEPLGRAMGDHRPRIRHVPFHPTRGITESHVEFIKAASLVIVVASEPLETSTTNEPCPDLTGAPAYLPSQMQFANVVRSIVQSAVHGSTDEAVTPAVLITVGQDLMHTWESRCGALHDWSLVLNAASISPPAMRKAADVLFGAATADEVDASAGDRGSRGVERGMQALCVERSSREPSGSSSHSGSGG